MSAAPDKEATMYPQPTSRRRTTRVTVSVCLTVAAALFLVQSALARGEAKNESPFTRVTATAPSDQSDVVSRYLVSHGITGGIAGESKNELPFTRNVVSVPSDQSDVVSRYLGSHGLASQPAVAPGKAQAEARNEVLGTPRITSERGAGYVLRRDGRLAQITTVSSSGNGGFDWKIAGLVAALVAMVAAGTAALLLVGQRVPRTA